MPAKAQINKKRTCFGHGWHGEFSFVNRQVFIAEKAIYVKNKRKINLFNKSKRTSIGLGLMAKFADQAPKFDYGLTTSAQLGFVKIKFLTPMLRYSLLFNSPNTSSWLGFGFNLRIVSDIGLRYSYNFNLAGGQNRDWGHNLGVYVNFKTKKEMCFPRNKREKSRKKD